MTKGEAQALDELHRTPEELSARTAQMDKLARNGKQGGYLAADTLETRVQAPEPAPTRTRTRKERADKGKARLYVDLELCGVRFDISGEMGRDALKAFLAVPRVRGLEDLGNSPAEMAIDALLGIIDRLRGK